MSKKRPEPDPAEVKREIEEQSAELVEDGVLDVPDSTEPDPVAVLEAAFQAERDRALRLAAEYDNYRKRSQKEREALYVDVKTNVAAAFLPVYDNLERALKQETEDEAYAKGVEMTMAQLKEVFQKLGVEEIKAVGERFDPERHNAVYHIEDEAYGESEVVEQFMAGFILGGKVIRHSMVKVAN